MWWTSKEKKAQQALAAANCRTVQLAYECWKLCVTPVAVVDGSEGSYIILKVSEDQYQSAIRGEEQHIALIEHMGFGLHKHVASKAVELTHETLVRLEIARAGQGFDVTKWEEAAELLSEADVSPAFLTLRKLGKYPAGSIVTDVEFYTDTLPHKVSAFLFGGLDSSLSGYAYHGIDYEIVDVDVAAAIARIAANKAQTQHRRLYDFEEGFAPLDTLGKLPSFKVNDFVVEREGNSENHSDFAKVMDVFPTRAEVGFGLVNMVIYKWDGEVTYANALDYHKYNRFVLKPGEVVSQTDGQTHPVTARQLAELYRAPLGECRVYGEGYGSKTNFVGDVLLEPRFDGRYDLEYAILEQQGLAIE